MARVSKKVSAAQREAENAPHRIWKTAIYARLSDFDDVLRDTESLEVQISYIKEYINHRDDLMLLDVFADKLLVLSTMISLCGQGLIPSWACVVVLFRELAVDGLRLVAMEQGRVIAAGKLGKIKTCTQMAMLVAYLLSAIGWLRVPALNWTLLAVAMAMTLWSGVDYFRKNRALFAGGLR